MIPEAAKAVADAVLYEGFMLYPYRATSLKNAQRWTFGGLNPRVCCAANDPASGWCQQTEFLVHGSPSTRLTTSIRFLHLCQTEMAAGNPAASERVISLGELLLKEITTNPRRCEFSFPDENQTPVEAAYATIAGVCELSAEPLEANLYRVTLRVSNLSEVEVSLALRCGVYPQTMAAVHAVCSVSDGQFLSLTDPPEFAQAAARCCQNIGAWPILLGQPGEAALLLCSPIILCDYPQIAAASPGDLFDGTEIDEILTLRIRTLTDDEKQELHDGDERIRRLLQRSESLSPEQLLRLHAQMQPQVVAGDVS